MGETHRRHRRRRRRGCARRTRRPVAIPTISASARPLQLVRGDGGADLAATLDGAGELTDLGVSDVHLPIVAFVRDEAGVGPCFDELASRWG